MAAPSDLRSTTGLTSSWRTWLPPAFVALSLLALLLTPPVLNWLIRGVRDDVLAPAQDARGEVNQIIHAYSQAEAAVRGYLLTGEPRFLETLDEARAKELESLARLRPLLAELDPALAGRLDALRARSDRADAARQVLLQGPAAGGEAFLVAEERRHERLIADAQSIRERIVDRIARARARTRDLERLGNMLVLVLGGLALASAMVVVVAGRQFRRRALEEAELRSAALTLTEAVELEEVLSRIVHVSRRGRGESSYVERIERDGEWVEVIAAAGRAAPAVGTRVPYPGSLTEEVIRTGNPEVVRELGRGERPIVAHLSPEAHRSSALVLPLRADRAALGALVVLRHRRSFHEREVSQRRLLGILAALALRKAMLLREAREQHEELQRANRSRERLIRGFGHDVRNPLGAADAYASNLAEGIGGALTPEQARSLERIRASIGSALLLIGDLIDLARAEAGQLEIRRERVDVGALVSSVADRYRAGAAAAGLALEADLPESLPAIESDPRRIEQVLGNLLSNAVKYTPPGGRVRISAGVLDGRRAEDPARWLNISVADTGPGIPAEQREVLFEEFRRLDHSAIEGAGLGLSISARVANLLGGELTLESEEGAGSTFTLRLPSSGRSPEQGT